MPQSRLWRQRSPRSPGSKTSRAAGASPLFPPWDCRAGAVFSSRLIPPSNPQVAEVRGGRGGWGRALEQTLRGHSVPAQPLRAAELHHQWLGSAGRERLQRRGHRGYRGHLIPGRSGPKNPGVPAFPPRGFLGFEWGLGVQRCGLRWEEGFGLEGGWGAFCG